jgi:hypothetical protein
MEEKFFANLGTMFVSQKTFRNENVDRDLRLLITLLTAYSAVLLEKLIFS